MVIFTATNYGCVFTLDEDSNELYYAPIYADDTVNLAEFAPVDMESADMDEMELFDIRKLNILQKQKHVKTSLLQFWGTLMLCVKHCVRTLLITRFANTNALLVAIVMKVVLSITKKRLLN